MRRNSFLLLQRENNVMILSALQGNKCFSPRSSLQIRKSGNHMQDCAMPFCGFAHFKLHPGLATLQSPMEPCAGSHPCTREVRALFDVCLQTSICHGLTCCAHHAPAGLILLWSSQHGDILAVPCAMPSWAVSQGHKHSQAGSRCRNQGLEGVFIP